MTFNSLRNVYMTSDCEETISNAFNQFMNEESTRTDDGNEIVELYNDAQADIFEHIAKSLKCDVTRISILKVMIHQ